MLVAIRNFAFLPDSVRLAAGTSVTWLNCGDAGAESHTSTSDGAVWNSPTLAPGQRYSHAFGATGTFPYHCSIHPGMTGKIVVQ